MEINLLPGPDCSLYTQNDMLVVCYVKNVCECKKDNIYIDYVRNTCELKIIYLITTYNNLQILYLLKGVVKSAVELL